MVRRRIACIAKKRRNARRVGAVCRSERTLSEKQNQTFVLNLHTPEDVLNLAPLTNAQAAELIEALLQKAGEPGASGGPSVKITPKTSTVSEEDKASFTVRARM